MLIPAPRLPPLRHEDIIEIKRRICHQRAAIKKARTHVAHFEAALSRIAPQHVVACVEPGYDDPAHRVAQAEANKAAGHPGPLTFEDAMKIKRGEMARPKWDNSRPMYSEIRAMKQYVAHFSTLADLAQADHDLAEAHLHSLDPQAVIRAKVADYADHPEIVARAQAGESP